MKKKELKNQVRTLEQELYEIKQYVDLLNMTSNKSLSFDFHLTWNRINLINKYHKPYSDIEIAVKAISISRLESLVKEWCAISSIELTDKPKHLLFTNGTVYVDGVKTNLKPIELLQFKSLSLWVSSTLVYMIRAFNKTLTEEEITELNDEGKGK